MGFFSKILDKLGLHKDKDKAAEKPAAEAAKFIDRPKEDFIPKGVPAAATAAKPVAAHAETGDAAHGKAKDDVVAAKVTPISETDVLAQLEKLSAGSGLNWKVSIVDLLKVLDIDSSREARNELATELGCPADLMHDSAKMNVWLHKEVLKQIAANGGNIPQSLLD